jgi:hypothetical protein
VILVVSAVVVIVAIPVGALSDDFTVEPIFVREAWASRCSGQVPCRHVWRDASIAPCLRGSRSAGSWWAGGSRREAAWQQSPWVFVSQRQLWLHQAGS